MLFISSWINIHLFVHFSFFLRRRSSRLFDPGDNWFPAFSPPGCVPDGCVYTRSAAYEFRIMMDGRAKSKEHETAFAATPHVSIHLLLMQQPQRRGSGTLRWRPNEPWVIYHVSSQSSSPDIHNSILTFFLFAFISCSLFLPLLLSIFPLLHSHFSFFVFFPSCLSTFFCLPSLKAFLHLPSCLFLSPHQSCSKCCPNFKFAHMFKHVNRGP